MRWLGRGICDDRGVHVRACANWPGQQRPLGCDEAWTRRNVTRSHSYVSHLVVVTRGARLGSEHMVNYVLRALPRVQKLISGGHSPVQMAWLDHPGTRAYATGCALSTARFQLSAGWSTVRARPGTYHTCDVTWPYHGMQFREEAIYQSAFAYGWSVS